MSKIEGLVWQGRGIDQTELLPSTPTPWLLIKMIIITYFENHSPDICACITLQFCLYLPDKIFPLTGWWVDLDLNLLPHLTAFLSSLNIQALSHISRGQGFCCPRLEAYLSILPWAAEHYQRLIAQRCLLIWHVCSLGSVSGNIVPGEICTYPHFTIREGVGLCPK